MAYTHGVYVTELDTELVVPVRGTAGLQVVVGTAPVHLAEDSGTVLEPKLCYSFDEAVAALGYSDDWESYTLCQSMWATFQVKPVAPVVLINVLDPGTHKEAVAAASYTVTDHKATVNVDGILEAGLTVKSNSSTLAKDTDYKLVRDAKTGYLKVELLPDSTYYSAATLTINGNKIDPDAVDADDIVGVSEAAGGPTGLECIRLIYPMFGMTPGIITAPGWSQDPDVSSVMIGKCTGINGNKSCVCFVDVDSDTGKAEIYTGAPGQKAAQGLANKNCMGLWPMVEVGSKVMWMSAMASALMAYTDANNEDVPALLASNKLIGITGAVTRSGAKVLLDQEQANLLNANGIGTVLNLGAWRFWGNRTSVYPTSTDPKDCQLNIRRMFNWWANTIIDTYLQRVDDLLNPRLKDEIIASENIRGNYFVSRGWVATARCRYLASDNPQTDLVDGILRLRLALSPYPGAETISFLMQYDSNAVAEAFEGGAG